MEVVTQLATRILIQEYTLKVHVGAIQLFNTELPY